MTRQYDKMRGGMLIVGSCALFCVAGCLVRQAAYIGPVRIALFRFVIGLGLITGAAVFGRVKLRFNDRRLLFLRGLTGGTAVFIAFLAITELGLGKGTVIICSYPIFASIFSAIFLKERLRLVNVAAIVIAFSGIYLISSDDSDGLWTFSVFGKIELITIFGAVLGGIAVTLIRKLHDTDNSAAIYFSQCSVGMWLVLLPALKGGVAIGSTGMLLLLGIGVFATVGPLLMTEGYKYVPVKTGSLLCMLDPVAAYIAGVVIFGEPLVARSVVGAVLVVAACASVLVGRKDERRGGEIAEVQV